MNLTPEQQAAIDAVVSGRDVFLRSGAGTGKTTTLEAMITARGRPAIALAFNKDIAEELQEKLQTPHRARSFNSIGWLTWKAHVGRPCPPDGSKLRKLLDLILEKANLTLPRDVKSDIVSATGWAKNNGLVPRDCKQPGKSLVPDTDGWWSEHLREDLHCKLARLLLNLSINEAYKGNIDFDDQVYMPACFACVWEKPELLAVDEAQDLNPVNIQIIKKLGPKQLIAVGDPWQAIYAFRGALHDSWDQLLALRANRNNPIELPLSITFRCSQAVVQEANKHVASLRARPDAPAGSVSVQSAPFDPTICPPGGAILCRNNAPLARAALALLSAGRPIRLLASDSLGSLSMDIRAAARRRGPFHANLSLYFSEKISRTEDESLQASLADRRDMLLSLNRGDPEDLIATLSKLMVRSNKPTAVTLSTIHRAKGLEWPDVFLLDPHLIPAPWAEGPQLAQELNLRYVAQTRAKLNLTYVYTKGQKQ